MVTNGWFLDAKPERDKSKRRAVLEKPAGRDWVGCTSWREAASGSQNLKDCSGAVSSADGRQCADPQDIGDPELVAPKRSVGPVCGSKPRPDHKQSGELFGPGEPAAQRRTKRVSDIDMQHCPDCGAGQLKIIAAIRAT